MEKISVDDIDDMRGLRMMTAHDCERIDDVHALMESNQKSCT